MKRIFADFQFVCAYIDGVIVFSGEMIDQEETLRQLFDWIFTQCIKVKLSKCVLFQEIVEILWHILNYNGIILYQNKVEKISKTILHTKNKDLCSFLGILGYYTHFI